MRVAPPMTRAAGTTAAPLPQVRIEEISRVRQHRTTRPLDFNPSHPPCGPPLWAENRSPRNTRPALNNHVLSLPDSLRRRSPPGSRPRTGRPAWTTPPRPVVTGRATSATTTASTGSRSPTPRGIRIPGDGSGQTIAIVDAYDAPNIAADLHVFDQQFGLPDPPSFVKVNQTGGTNYPRPDDGWGMEIALDVEWAHAMAPRANILLVESTTNDDSDMWAAVDYARKQPGVVAVSMSWGEPEYAGQSEVDAHLVTPERPRRGDVHRLLRR